MQKCTILGKIIKKSKSTKSTIFRFSFSIPEDATVEAKARMIILINVFVKLKSNFVVFYFLY